MEWKASKPPDLAEETRKHIKIPTTAKLYTNACLTNRGDDHKSTVTVLRDLERAGLTGTRVL